MTSGDSSLFIFALVDCVALIGISVFNLINLSDLECDYINAANCCAKLNKIVLPELIFHGVVTLGMLYNWHAILFLLLLLPFLYLLNRFVSVPVGNIGYYDPTQIHNRTFLKLSIRETMVKLFFYIGFFFVSMYSLVYSLITWSMPNSMPNSMPLHVYSKKISLSIYFEIVIIFTASSSLVPVL